MLGSSDIVAFVPSRSPKRSRSFYEQTLGLRFVSDDQFASVFNANHVMVRVVDVSGIDGFRPFPFTILGWSVEDVGKTVKALQKKGVKFERYEGMNQDQLGIWTSPSGARIAWFKDPDGNVLSLSEH
ncbi:MAG TPA: VOC family protein [Gemmatimonadaceae bacterium]|nr:VOC family protein [Gemmatimonadaceae bacterium]